MLKKKFGRLGMTFDVQGIHTLIGFWICFFVRMVPVGKRGGVSEVRLMSV